jgi:hypothetical protein
MGAHSLRHRKAKIMTSVLSLLTVDIAGLIAALSIWTASFVLLLRSQVGSEVPH